MCFTRVSGTHPFTRGTPVYWFKYEGRMWPDSLGPDHRTNMSSSTHLLLSLLALSRCWRWALECVTAAKKASSPSCFLFLESNQQIPNPRKGSFHNLSGAAAHCYCKMPVTLNCATIGFSLGVLKSHPESYFTVLPQPRTQLKPTRRRAVSWHKMAVKSSSPSGLRGFGNPSSGPREQEHGDGDAAH